MTIIFGLNDRDLIVGRFADSSGVERGFVLQLPDTVVVFDRPEATLTSLNGINNNNLMCGRFEDSSGVVQRNLGSYQARGPQIRASSKAQTPSCELQIKPRHEITKNFGLFVHGASQVCDCYEVAAVSSPIA